MNRPIPRTISEFLDHLRICLHDADPALVQDALYDAEEYLRAACAEHPALSEAEVIERVRSQFGMPDEVAAAYRETDATVTRALRSPAPPKARSLVGKVFGVYTDPRTYGSLFYMLLALATGIFYFTWATAGVSMSLGLSILIIGIPFILLFLGTVRLISLVEGRIVEVLLGERMPRRPLYPRAEGLIDHIKLMLKDGRTWLTLLYMLAMLPLGVVYFTIMVTGIVTSVGLMVAPFVQLWVVNRYEHVTVQLMDQELVWPWTLVLIPMGFLLLTGFMHLARFIGSLHGRLAKHLLVRS